LLVKLLHRLRVESFVVSGVAGKEVWDLERFNRLKEKKRAVW